MTTPKFKLERRNPLPAGRYWQDIFSQQFSAFDDWLARNRDTLDLLKEEYFAPTGIEILKDPSDPTKVGGRDLGQAERKWVLFEIIEPTKWEGPGLPTIADDGVNSSTDTERPTDEIVPGPFDPGGAFNGFGGVAGSLALGFGAVLAAGLVLQALIGRVVGR